jgi:YjbE family integral membrane protein
MLHADISHVADARFWSAALGIVFVNILLSGDNAVVIAMACRALPRRQRTWGFVIGAGLSAVLLITFAAVVTHLLQLPYLKLAGGLALLYIAARLLLPDDDGADHAEAATNLWHAVRLVVVADIVMSFDNILAVAQIARGDLALLAIGLIVSIPIVIAGAAVITTLLDRWPILTWAGSALLGWVAGQAIVQDTAIADLIARLGGEKISEPIALTAGCVGAVLVIAAGGIWRRWRTSKPRRRALRRGGAT